MFLQTFKTMRLKSNIRSDLITARANKRGQEKVRKEKKEVGDDITVKLGQYFVSLLKQFLKVKTFCLVTVNIDRTHEINH